jgi:hypothetical protein
MGQERLLQGNLTSYIKSQLKDINCSLGCWWSGCCSPVIASYTFFSYYSYFLLLLTPLIFHTSTSYFSYYSAADGVAAACQLLPHILSSLTTHTFFSYLHFLFCIPATHTFHSTVLCRWWSGCCMPDIASYTFFSYFSYLLLLFSIPAPHTFHTRYSTAALQLLPHILSSLTSHTYSSDFPYQLLILFVLLCCWGVTAACQLLPHILSSLTSHTYSSYFPYQLLILFILLCCWWSGCC